MSLLMCNPFMWVPKLKRTIALQCPRIFSHLKSKQKQCNAACLRESEINIRESLDHENY